VRLCRKVCLGALGLQILMVAIPVWLRQSELLDRPGLSEVPTEVWWALVSLARAIPLYVGAWVVPAVVAAEVARERLSGRWDSLAVSRASTADLWAATLLAPMWPWLIAAVVLCWPYGIPGLDTALPGIGIPLPNGGGGTLTFENEPWTLLPLAVGVAASAIAFGALGAICGYRARSPRSAAATTCAIIGGICYAGALLSLASPILGEWARMPALGYALWLDPAALLAPSWMVGGTIYSIRSEWVGEWIVWITVGVFAVLAALMSAAAYQVVRLVRRPAR
jgi:hypothetical protein